MSSGKQQALSRFLDVSGPGCFNEETGTWMVGRRHHHRRRHVAPPPPPEPSSEPASEPASEPVSESEAPSTKSQLSSITTKFYPDYASLANRSPLSPGTRFSSIVDMTKPRPYPRNPGNQRRNYKLVIRGGIHRPAVIVQIP